MDTEAASTSDPLTVDPAPGEETPERPRRPLGLMLCVAVLFGSMGFQIPALIDPTGAPPPEASLDLPQAYVLLSPVTRILDGLTLLGVSQHIMVIVSILGLGAGLGVRGSQGALRRLLRGAAGFGLALAGALALYALVALVPRPMPSLVLDDPDQLAIDFHTHSRHSHDVGERHVVDWSADWHTRAGFDAFVLSDHSVWAGVAELEALQQADRGSDVDEAMVLSGIEVWLAGEHIIALGDSTRYTNLFNDIRNAFMNERSDELTRRPSFIVTIPGTPFRLPPLNESNPMGVIAIEVHDGAPRGLEQGRAQRDSIIEWAQTHDLALVSGSNNHGAGQTPTAWTIMTIPGWDEMEPRALLATIEDVLHENRFEATQVLERPAPSAQSSVALVLTVPALILHAVRSLTTPERLVWLLYLLGLWAVSWFPVRRRR